MRYTPAYEAGKYTAERYEHWHKFCRHWKLTDTYSIWCDTWRRKKSVKRYAIAVLVHSTHAQHSTAQRIAHDSLCQNVIDNQENLISLNPASFRSCVVAIVRIPLLGVIVYGLSRSH